MAVIDYIFIALCAIGIIVGLLKGFFKLLFGFLAFIGRADRHSLSFGVSRTMAVRSYNRRFLAYDSVGSCDVYCVVVGVRTYYRTYSKTFAQDNGYTSCRQIARTCDIGRNGISCVCRT